MPHRFLRNILCNPVFLSELRLRQSLRAEINSIPLKGNKILDLGCGQKQYKDLFLGADYFGIDVRDSGRSEELKTADMYYDGVNIPFRNDLFDVVLCTQVLEHAVDPVSLLLEAKRVCKSDGVILLSVPFVYPEHEEPFDFRRYSSFGVYQLAKTAGCRVQSLTKDTTTIEVIFVLINLFFINSLLPNIRFIKPIFSIVFCFPVQLLAASLSKILSDRSDLYFNVVAKIVPEQTEK